MSATGPLIMVNDANLQVYQVYSIMSVQEFASYSRMWKIDSLPWRKSYI